MKQNVTAFLIASFLLQGCYHYAYYVSPFDSNNSTYHTIPLRSDSVTSALFISGSLISGMANEQGEGDGDGVYDFHTNIYRTHNLGFLELFYGLDLTLGNYSISKYDSVGNSYTVNYRIINKNAGNKFFGGIGLNAGFDFAIPLGRSEWRIGMDISGHNEFGSYSKFRNQLPDSAATFIVRDPSLVTISFTSEFAFRTRHGSWGFKLMSGKVLNASYEQVYESLFQESHSFYNSSFTFQYSYEKYTAYFMESASPLSFSIQLGCNYRISKKKKNPLTNLY
jgi:hypothetical protein